LLLSAFYVAPGGSNSADGSALHPWATIQKAANTVAAGDTVYVAPGQYNITAGITSNTSGTSSAPIRFISTTPWGAKVVATGVQDIWTNGGSYVTIQGFDITGNSAAFIGILNNGSYCNIIGNRVHNLLATGAGEAGGAGIDNWGNGTSTSNNIIGNWVFDIGTVGIKTDTVHGIYLSSYGGNVSNNIVYNNQGWGIQTWHNAQGATISNNLVWGNGYGGIVIGAGDNYATKGAGDYFTVTNNIVLDNTNTSGNAGIEEENDGGGTDTHNVYVDNICYGNAYNDYRSFINETAAAPLMVNPLLVNFQANGTGNYQLSAGSPCIGAGTSLGMPSTDIDGVARPPNGPYDIGPYQYTSTPTPTSSPTPPTDVVLPVVITSAEIEVVGRQRVIVLQLSGPVNSATADKLASYQLTQRRKGVQLVLATYNPANNTIWLRTRLALPPKLRYPFTLTLVGLKDAHSNPVGGTFSIA